MTKAKKALTLFSLLLAGCSAMGPSFEPAAPPTAESSLVYIYRPSQWDLTPVSPGILIDGTERVLLKNNGYSFFYLQPGVHTFTLKLSDRYEGVAQVKMNLEAGRSYFVKVDGESTYGFFKSISFRIIRVPEEIARGEIVACNYLDPEKSGKFSKSLLFYN